MGAIAMRLNARFSIYLAVSISANMLPPINHQHSEARRSSTLRNCCAIKSGANNQQIKAFLKHFSISKQIKSIHFKISPLHYHASLTSFNLPYVK